MARRSAAGRRSSVPKRGLPARRDCVNAVVTDGTIQSKLWPETVLSSKLKKQPYPPDTGVARHVEGHLGGG